MILSSRPLAAVAAAILLLWLACAAQAQVPRKIAYQGYLTNSVGQPVTATLAMTFRIYNVASGGSALHTESQSVTVAAGVFNVVLGTAPPLTLAFDVPYFLGITVGADAEMTPRQPLSASPYAIRAASAETLITGATVSGAQVSGALTGATLPAGSLTGTIGTAQVANNAVTQGKLSPLSGAAAGKVLGTDGTNLQWQNAGAGTVTSVATGTGLAGGPITGSGTVSLSASYQLPQACANGQVPQSNGAGGWTCATPVPNCVNGQTVRRVSGAWTCVNLPPTVLRHSNMSGDTGRNPAVAIGTDGRPNVAFSDELSHNVWVQTCIEVSCVLGATMYPLDSTPMVFKGGGPAIAIGADGSPLVAYQDSNGKLRVAKCTDTRCAGATPVVVAEPAGAGGVFRGAIVLKTGGLPAIGYTTPLSEIYFGTCANAACSTGFNATSVHVASPTWHDFAMLIPPDGKPVFAFADLFTNQVKLVKCSNDACNGMNTLTPFAVTTSASGVDAAIGADTFPVLAFDGGGTRILKCSTPDCSGSISLNTIVGGTGSIRPSIKIGPDGLPLVAFFDGLSGQVKLAKCGNASCSSVTSTSVIGPGQPEPSYSPISIGIPPDGLPVVAYTSQGMLNVVKCTNPTCSGP